MKPTASKASAAEDRPVGDGTSVHLGPLAELVGYSLRRAQLAVFQDFIVKMKDFALRPAQFSVLAIIQANPGLKQSQVSEALGINRANFVALLDELEHRNLARRAPSPDDRRSNALYLTPQGEAFLAEALQHLQTKHERRLEEVLGETGKRQLLDLLQKLASLG
ncbi:MAG TPA: MarR family transcriptional regulator [Ferrovibrio sp.]|jgi:DNA-binding MarR family transcriptional regulator|uniref:MarR family winged helix-turn-helix transcriptional regulator n=1 Tax=Ferrovibrio sp. TaxID=1917215 RepID=UPI002B4B6A56|nr:MarR family transcriptional regulator [Ferrovibrio sp.]HLT79058.1 MarR family transcriptional regulator [Ferrovibrio sp.]